VPGGTPRIRSSRPRRTRSSGSSVSTPPCSSGSATRPARRRLPGHRGGLHPPSGVVRLPDVSRRSSAASRRPASGGYQQLRVGRPGADPRPGAGAPLRDAGHQRPGRLPEAAPGIFRHALERMGVHPSEALHVGDSYAADVVGARRVGIRAVLIDRNGATRRGSVSSATTRTAGDRDLYGLLDLLGVDRPASGRPLSGSARPALAAVRRRRPGRCRCGAGDERHDRPPPAPPGGALDARRAAAHDDGARGSHQVPLDEDRIPRLTRPTTTSPPTCPRTDRRRGPPSRHRPAGRAGRSLAPLFPMALIGQEVSAEREIEIPDPVRQAYALYRPSPLYRARRLEQALDTPAHIYYKYEGVSPAGSHKPNTAIAQAFYNKQEGSSGWRPRPAPASGAARSPSPARSSGSRSRSTWSAPATTRSPTGAS
jgi:hypothetical protein